MVLRMPRSVIFEPGDHFYFALDDHRWMFPEPKEIPEKTALDIIAKSFLPKTPTTSNVLLNAPADVRRLVAFPCAKNWTPNLGIIFRQGYGLYKEVDRSGTRYYLLRARILKKKGS